MTDQAFSCRCGKLKGRVHDATPAHGTHVRCFCPSCRAATIYTGGADPQDKGVTVWQTTPDKITIDEGADRLAVFSFSPTGLLRWQAACCGAALFNTLRNPKIPMVAVIVVRLADRSAIGPVECAAFVPRENGKPYSTNRKKLYGGTLKRGLKARLDGRWKQTPFIDTETGDPTCPVLVLPQGTKDALLV